MGGEDEPRGATVRLRHRLRAHVQRAGVANEPARPGAEDHAGLPQPPSVVVLLRRQGTSAAHCVLSSAENQRVRRREGEVGEENSSEVPKVKFPASSSERNAKRFSNFTDTTSIISSAIVARTIVTRNDDRQPSAPTTP